MVTKLPEINQWRIYLGNGDSADCCRLFGKIYGSDGKMDNDRRLLREPFKIKKYEERRVYSTGVIHNNSRPKGYNVIVEWATGEIEEMNYTYVEQLTRRATDGQVKECEIKSLFCKIAGNK